MVDGVVDGFVVDGVAGTDGVDVADGATGVTPVAGGVVVAPGPVPGAQGCNASAVAVVPLEVPVVPVDVDAPVPLVPVAPGVDPGTADACAPVGTGRLATGTQGMVVGVFAGPGGVIVVPGEAGVPVPLEPGCVAGVCVPGAAVLCASSGRPDSESASAALHVAARKYLITVPPSSWFEYGRASADAATRRRQL